MTLLFPAWVIWGIIYVGIRLYQYYTRPEPPSPESRLLELAGNLPRTDEGTPVPQIYGRCMVKKPLLVWYGAPVSKLTGSAPNAKYRYGLNMLFVVGAPMTPKPAGGYNSANLPMLHRVWVGDKQVQTPSAPFYAQPGGAYPDGTAAGTWSGGPRIFAHTKGPSPTGISGDTMIGQIEFFNGHPDQALVSAYPGTPGSTPGSRIWYFMAQEGEDVRKIPGYRDQILVAFTPDGNKYSTPKIPAQHSGLDDAFCIGDSPMPPQFGFEVSSYGQDVFGNFRGFGDDADPMEVLYDIVTSDWGKVAFPSANVDTTTWQAASSTLKGEQHGYSRCHFDTEDAKQVVGDIMGQLGGVMYEEPTNGKLVVKLIRNDYVIGNLPAFSPTTGILRAENFTHGTWQNITNGVDLNYIDRSAGYLQRMIPARNAGNAAGQANRNRPINISYPGISNATLAAKVAMRELTVVSQPLAKGRFVFDRRASALRPGDAIRIQNWTELGIVDQVFRVINIDLGDLFTSEIVVEVMQDQWSTNLAVQGDTEVEPDFLYAAPFQNAKRFVTEAPRNLQWRTWLQGDINDPDVQRIWGIAKPDQMLDAAAGQSYRVDTQNTFANFVGGGLNNIFGVNQSQLQGILEDPTKVLTPVGQDPVYFHNTDVPQQAFQSHALMDDGFPGTAYPGPTAAAMVIKNVGTDIFENLPTNNGPSIFPPEPNLQLLSMEAAIRLYGQNMIVVGTPDAHEIMAFDSWDDNGDGTYTLNDIWRELGDTVARDWPADTPIYFVRTKQCGRRGWANADELLAFTRQQSFYRDDTGGDGSQDACDGVTITGRCFRPLRGQNLRLATKRAAIEAPPNDFIRDVVGVKGDPPSITDHFTEVTHLDGDLGVYLRRRNLLMTGSLSRGDDVDETQSQTGVGYVVEATKVAIDDTEGSAVNIATLGDVAMSGNQGYAFGAVGHGNLNLYVRTTRTVQAGETIGPPPGTVLSSWQSPCVKIVAPRWRNLLANARFNYGDLTAWTTTQGLINVVNDSNSVRRDTSGFYARGIPPGSIPIMYQEQSVAGFKPARMKAQLVWYGRNINSDADDNVTITFTSRDSGGNVLDSQSGASSFPTASWQASGFTISSLHASTAKMRVQVQFNQAGDVDNNSDCVVSEFELILGQFNYNVLTNDSFDDGTTSGWTVDSGSFNVPFAAPGPSPKYLQGGASASSQIHQDYTLPAGWEVGGTAVIRFWRMQTITNDVGSVFLEVLDGSNNVLAESLMEDEALPTLNRWYPHRLSVEIPRTGVAAKIRVTMIAIRTAGSGDSGACFDDMRLSVHKDLDPALSIDAKFEAPSAQQMPETWQGFHLCYPTLPLCEVMDGKSLEISGNQHNGDLIWTDGSFNDPVKVHGQFGQGVASVNAYGFTRLSGDTAKHIASHSTNCFTGRVGRALSTRKAGFTAIVLFRVNETTFNTACGLLGRMTATRGWGLGIDASGFVRARMRGDAGNKTATRTGLTVTDGALHMAAITWDPAAEQLHVDDERGRTSTSTSSGLGEFHAVDAFLRIGRDEQATDTLPGDIARVYVFRRPLTSGQIASVWNYGKDPSGKLASYTRSVPVWCPGVPDDDGETLALISQDQIAIGYRTYLDGITGLPVERYGLALSKGYTSIIPSFDLFGASWVLQSGATRALCVDATGRNLGAKITGANGIKLVGMTVTAGATIRLIVYLRSPTATITAVLLNSSDVVKQTLNENWSNPDDTLKWHRHVFDFTAWDGSTATCRIILKSDVNTLDITHVMYAHQSVSTFNEPALWHRDALGAIASDITATLNTTGMNVQYNTEGEVMIVGVGIEDDPPSAASIVRVRNTTNAKNTRELVTQGSAPRFIHYDGAASPAAVNSDGSVPDWTQGFEIRGRWRRIGTLDAASAFAGIRVVADTSSNSYGRSSTWTPSTDLNNQIQLGVASAANSWNGFLTRIRLTACEETI